MGIHTEHSKPQVGFEPLSNINYLYYFKSALSNIANQFLLNNIIENRSSIQSIYAKSRFYISTNALITVQLINCVITN
jgi:hypothetical protein